VSFYCYSPWAAARSFHCCACRCRPFGWLAACSYSCRPTLTFSNPGLSSINASETRDAQGAGDIAIFPLAFPVIAGPGSLAAVVLVMGRTEVWVERAAVVLMVAICLAVTYVAMLVSERLVRRLGQTGSDVVGRISGVLLAGLVVQFIFDGVRQAALFAPA
jgi:multiple antibiotic resistance protein